MKRMDPMIKKIIAHLERTQGSSIADGPAEFEIDPMKFRALPDCPSKKIMSFIDGGNMEVIRTPGLSVFFNRIARIDYRSNQRVSSNILEFYSIISALDNGGKIVYHVEFEPHGHLPEMDFDSFDASVSAGQRMIPISKIGDIIRRFAELKQASVIKDSIAVLDGSLEHGHPMEEGLLRDICASKEILALAKTSSMLAGSGASAYAALDMSCNLDDWSYLLKDSSIQQHIVKLHKSSRYRFSIDSPHLTDEMLWLLKENSKDPVFLGYPYGLIDADRRARVSKKEQETLMLQLQVKLKSTFPRLLSELNSLNAHDILDSLG
jgi:hypothetical protein